MSKKISVINICNQHFKTLNIRDMVSFFGLPIVLVILALMLDIRLFKDTLSLLVSFGSIFTALLLSLLVLIFDQETKLDEKADLWNSNNLTIPLFKKRKELLGQLYSNISFSIICALTLVIACLVLSQLLSYKLPSQSNILISNWFLNPLVVFLLTLTALNIFMILKRIHTLLTVKPEDGLLIKRSNHLSDSNNDDNEETLA
ncbi:hypothetical protein MUB05_13520 [Acinetobacter indicus]|uniref:hypothetical protein n=1 Tax=Acinetobacter TaxID=469 RepID=UPI0015D0EE1D|nr:MULTISPECIES: hypothetical protein [Acinetobacter]MCP0917579.1 hypothetical protein [Acinetobacter indicus]MCP0920692.1 hypothetical protein [Acinetobacter indicus]MCP0923359.1 hypothetical protein [Acinetobacter indicus]QSQ92380.1 hypothetical protein J0W32_08920 [Acinetobacter indicus]